MTVFGATTAVVAPTPYTPPYKYVTSYAPAPSVVGTATRPVSNNPTLAPGSSSGDYAWAYLSAHMMSWPSYRYIYLLWMIFALIALLYVLAHHLRLGASSSGAALSKWAIRRQPIGKRRSGGARGRALASNGVLLTSFILFVIAVVLSFLGPDYIAPTKGILSFSRRQFLTPGQIQYASPSYTIPKSFWTIASRLGDTAFALTPLTVLLAMKSPPVAILAWRGLAHLYSDKLATFHKITAWMVWGATTGHVALWTVQLFMDKNNGSAAWFAMWTNYRFIAGVVAYAAMTGVMMTSFRIVRQKQYEFFYITHVTLVFLTIALAAVHHPVLWFWMAAALLLWALERLWRAIRVWRINGRHSKSTPHHSSRNNKSTLLASQYEDLPQTDSYAMADLPRGSYIDKSLPRPPGMGHDSPGEWSPASTRRGSIDVGYGGKDEFGQHGRDGTAGYAEGSLQTLGAFDGRYSASSPNRNGGFSDPYDAPAVQNRNRRTSDRPAQLDVQSERPSTLHSTVTPSSGPVPVPVGQALAQILPSRTIRLTVHLARSIKWSPGQSVLLSLPELSKLQSHPFTITNLPNSEGEIVLLVKARKGLTRRLYDLVRDRHQSNLLMAKGRNDANGAGNVDTAPVLIGAKIDGPFGSAGRVRWGDHATVVIICGGSGVSFGVAVLEGIHQRIREGKGGRTTRIRFCWVAREYAEISWVAYQLQRCQSLIPPSQLQIEIYITNSVPLPLRSRQHTRGRPSTLAAYDNPSGQASADDLAPPRAAFAKSSPRPRSSSGGSETDQEQTFGRRSISMDSMASVASDMSVDEPYGRGYSDRLEVDEHMSDNYADVIDLTNYEDEEDVLDPREEALSSSVREQGKIRRAKSRKAGKGRGQGGDEGARRVSGRVPSDAYGVGMPSRLSGVDRYADEGHVEGHHRGMSKSASTPNGLSGSTIHQPIPRSGRSQLAISAYDHLSPATAEPTGGRRSFDQPRSSSADHRLPRPNTSYDLTPRPGSASSHLNPYANPQPLSSANGTNSLAPPHAILPVGSNPHSKRNSYASSYADSYAAYDPFSRGMGTNSPGASIRGSSIHQGGGYFDDGDRGSIAGESMRPIYRTGAESPGFRASRTGSMVLLDEAYGADQGDKRVSGGKGKGSRAAGGMQKGLGEGLWIDLADYESMSAMSELAISGKPALGALLEDEIERAAGSLIVATCGPTTLNTVVRNLVSSHISPSRIRKGDKRGHIAIYSEDYDG